MPLVLINVNIYDFPLNLSNEAMGYLEWGGRVGIYSSGGNPKQITQIRPNGDYFICYIFIRFGLKWIDLFKFNFDFIFRIKFKKIHFGTAALPLPLFFVDCLFKI